MGLLSHIQQKQYQSAPTSVKTAPPAIKKKIPASPTPPSKPTPKPVAAAAKEKVSSSPSTGEALSPKPVPVKKSSPPSENPISQKKAAPVSALPSTKLIPKPSPSSSKTTPSISSEQEDAFPSSKPTSSKQKAPKPASAKKTTVTKATPKKKPAITVKKKTTPKKDFFTRPDDEEEEYVPEEEEEQPKIVVPRQVLDEKPKEDDDKRNFWDRFFVLKVGPMALALRGRKKKDALKEAKKESPIQKKEETKEEDKKPHHTGLRVLFILLAIIAEVILLAILHRMNIIDLSPWLVFLSGAGGPVTPITFYVVIVTLVLAIFMFVLIKIAHRSKKKDSAMVDLKDAKDTKGTMVKPGSSNLAGQLKELEKKKGDIEEKAEQDTEETTEESSPTDVTDKSLSSEWGEISEKDAAAAARPEKRKETAVKLEPYETEIDVLYRHVQAVGKISIGEITQAFKISKDLAEEWAKVLEEHEMVSINYPIFGSPLLTPFKAERKVEE